jgi:hypothetical protein
MVDRGLTIIGLAGTLLFWAIPRMGIKIAKRWAYLGFGASAVLLVIGLGMLLLPVDAQPTAGGGIVAPGNSGVIAPGNSGIITQDQSGGNNTINKYAAPHRANALYDANSELGFVDGPIAITDDKKHITFGRIIYYDGFPWGKTITFQSRDAPYSISCPEKQDCPATGLCTDFQSNFSGQTTNTRAPATCDLK